MSRCKCNVFGGCLRFVLDRFLMFSNILFSLVVKTLSEKKNIDDSHVPFWFAFTL
jgi:hypothetical protein